LLNYSKIVSFKSMLAASYTAQTEESGHKKRLVKHLSLQLNNSILHQTRPTLAIVGAVQCSFTLVAFPNNKRKAINQSCCEW
jgi:hypothetical protein